MDADRFATLLRAFATRPSRRGMSRALAALLVGSALPAWRGLPEAAAKKRHKKKKKKKATPPPPAPSTQPGCAAGLTDCGGVCKDLQTDAGNCGACVHPCAAGNSCCAGTCKDSQTDEANCGTCGHTCATGETCCAGVCSDLKTDEANCATCGNVCSSTQQCSPLGGCCRIGGQPCVFGVDCCSTNCNMGTCA
jgi:hypothetical protein